MAEEKQKVQLTEEEQYLKDLVAKYNANPDDPTLSKSEKLLLNKVSSVEKEINDLAQEFVKLDNEIKERNEKMASLNQQILLRRGQSQGLVDSLLALREEGDTQPA